MPNEKRSTILANKFRIELDGIAITSFREFDPGDSKEREVITDREGTDPDHMTLSTGLRKPETLIVKKAAKDIDIKAVLAEFDKWYEGGDLDKRGGAVDYLNKSDQPYDRLVFEDAMCTKIVRPKPNATANDPAVYEFHISTPRTYTVAV